MSFPHDLFNRDWIELRQVADIFLLDGLEVIERCEALDLNAIPGSCNIKTYPGECQIHVISDWSGNRIRIGIANITGRAPMLTPPKLRELRHNDWVVDNDAITLATGWTPVVELREGLEQLKIPTL